MKKRRFDMIKVYQFALTDEEVDIINNGLLNEKAHAYFGRMTSRKFNTDNFKYYTHVANVLTDDLEQAFESMNLWEDNLVIKTSLNCYSMSVGDVLERDGKFFHCATCGFEEIEGVEIA